MMNRINDSSSHATSAISSPTITRFGVIRRPVPALGAALVFAVLGRALELVLFPAQPRLQALRAGAVELVWTLFEIARHVRI